MREYGSQVPNRAILSGGHNKLSSLVKQLTKISCIEIFGEFRRIFTKCQLLCLHTTLEIGHEKNTTFCFTRRFRYFRLNKSVLETAETKQPDSQLHFAPKIIKIQLLVFENELIDDTIPVPKKCQNRECVF